MKQVWRTRTSDSIPSDLGEFAIRRDGVVFRLSEALKMRSLPWVFAPDDSSDVAKRYDIVVYQTNRIKG